jgi:hypothetical protein
MISTGAKTAQKAVCAGMYRGRIQVMSEVKSRVLQRISWQLMFSPDHLFRMEDLQASNSKFFL